MGAEYLGALWMPADASNYRKGRVAPVSLLIIHATDGHPDPRGTAEMFATAGNKTSAHFVIGQDGTIVQCVSIHDTAEHAHAVNGHSIAIEHSARSPKEWGPNDPGLPPTAAQIEASARVCAWVCQQFGIAPSRETIQGHSACDPQTTHKDCPTGCGFNLDAYVILVQALASESLS